MSKARRVLIVGITLVALFAVYRVFVAGREPQGISKEDYNVGQPDESVEPTAVGRGRTVAVGTVKQTEYVMRDDQKNITRVFGFEELLHQSGDQWQLRKPYMKIYEKDAELVVTADSGTVQVQAVGTNPIPRDAKLTDNVQFHIVRKTQKGEEISDIYLDDIVFVSDRSTFYTDGPARLVSPQCTITGRGVEVVYSPEMEKLLLFRMDQLDEMRLPMRTGEAFFRQSKPGPQPSGDQASPSTGEQQGPQEQYYDCLLSDNVVVEYDGQVVLADKVTIRNILWTLTSRSSGAVSDSAASGSKDSAATGPEEATSTAQVRISCNGGIVIKPITGAVEEYRVRGAGRKGVGRPPMTAEELAGRDVFRARSLDYDMLTRDGFAQGPLDVTFFADTIGDPNVLAEKTKTTIAASRYAAYKASANEVRFVGDVVARAAEPTPDWTQTSTIYCDEAVAKIRSILRGQKTGLSSIEDVNCVGRIVRLETVRKRGEKLLGGANLKCANLRYDGDTRIVTAAGPGVIAVDNSRAEVKAQGPGDVSISRRCYAAVDKFGELRWFADSGRILARGADEGLRIAYWPVLDDGGYGSRIIIDTRSVQGTFDRLPDGRTEIDAINAFGGVYVERGEEQKIWGDSFLYEQGTGLLTVTGRPDKPCVYNGIQAMQFEMNVRDGSVKTKLAGGEMSP